jgi:hypothetical protein
LIIDDDQVFLLRGARSTIGRGTAIHHRGLATAGAMGTALVMSLYLSNVDQHRGLERLRVGNRCTSDQYLTIVQRTSAKNILNAGEAMNHFSAALLEH